MTVSSVQTSTNTLGHWCTIQTRQRRDHGHADGPITEAINLIWIGHQSHPTILKGPRGEQVIHIVLNPSLTTRKGQMMMIIEILHRLSVASRGTTHRGCEAQKTTKSEGLMAVSTPQARQ